MNYSQGILDAATAGREHLGTAARQVVAFTRSRLNTDGGFRGRDAASDLYYTVFGVDCLLALGEPVDTEALTRYLASFGDGAALDLPHLACLARCGSRISRGMPSEWRVALASRLERFRCPDGGYNPLASNRTGSIYGAFLALSSYRDLDLPMPDLPAMQRAVDALAIAPGQYANEVGGAVSTNAGVGALLLQFGCNRPADPRIAERLLAGYRPEGGFAADASIPIPDLVSTATAVYALTLTGADLSAIREPIREFVGSLWDEAGGFCGHWLDTQPDCEHTFYALLTFGCLQSTRAGSAQTSSPIQTRTDEARSSLRRALLAERNSSGFWEGRLSSSALATVVASFALRQAAGAAHEALVQRGLTWIIRHANADGGWGDSPESPSNLTATVLCWAALDALHPDDPGSRAARERATAWLQWNAGGTTPDALRAAVLKRYGNDRTFAGPILTMLTLTGCMGSGDAAWRQVPQLPFEFSVLPFGLFKWLKLTVVSYALPALIAVGLARHRNAPVANPALRFIRNRLTPRALAIAERMQPANGGYEEATPLTAFVAMSLSSAGYRESRIVRRGVAFLVQSIRPDGSWPIDTNLATWVTTLAVNALSEAGPSGLSPAEEARVRDWILAQQYDKPHPLTHGAPGGWSWTDLTGGMPDADDTSGVLLALRRLGPIDARVTDAASRSIVWLLDIQNLDGGIPTFSKGWGRLPFDRSCPDITAHALRSFWEWRTDVSPTLRARIDQGLARGLVYLSRSQQGDGYWVPLWFGNQFAPEEENRTYGTAQVAISLAVLAESGISSAHRLAESGRRWLVAAQNADGGWGGAPGVASSIEETSVSLRALAGSEHADAVKRCRHWLVCATGTSLLPASPIGLYFARLWYSERLYPLLFAVHALSMRSHGEIEPGKVFRL
jgi:squalene-hopene/tetraprenyl-beta-curcumene cyclase